MKALIDHDNHEMRDSCRSYMSSELFKPKYNISIDEERDLALKRLQALCDNNFISVLDFKNNPLKIFAAHELAVIVDPAMTTKMTVQFNLFGGTVLKLGTARHHDKLLAGKNCVYWYAKYRQKIWQSRKILKIFRKIFKVILKDECSVDALRACVFIYLPYILKNNGEFQRK